MLYYLVKRFIVFQARAANSISLEREVTDFDKIGEVQIGDDFAVMLQLTNNALQPIDMQPGSEARRYIRPMLHSQKMADFSKTTDISNVFGIESETVQTCSREFF